MFCSVGFGMYKYILHTRIRGCEQELHTEICMIVM